MRRNLIIGGVVVAVGVLIAVNLALREDPEPDFGQPRMPAAVTDDEPETPQFRQLVETEPATPEEREPEEREPALVLEPEGPQAECGHYLIPEVGTHLRYRWSQSRPEQSITMHMRSMSARELADGEVEVTWLVQVDGEEGQRQQLRRMTRCAPGGSAEEPWFGVLEELGLEAPLLGEPARWRWPAQLSRGVRFEGTAVFDASRAHAAAPDGEEGRTLLRVTRQHEVDGRERVEVPAGAFQAWRVTYEEEQRFGERGERGPGTMWIAPGVGLVKLRAENAAGIIMTMELLGVTAPSEG
ncbi:MAG: hypothetical protein RID81_12815 [Sandaracinaceae bacterium]|nr:MAG: hypothetical protein EVA89_33840 [Sandaracinaceae bacterium]